MQAARVLGYRASPRDRQCKEQRIEAGIIEALADVPAGSKDDSRLVAGDGRQSFGDGLSVLFAQTCSQHDQMSNIVDKTALETIQVLVTLG
jgi:hypothetical protein